MKLKTIALYSIPVLLLIAGIFVMRSSSGSNDISQMARNGAKEDELLKVVDQKSGKYNLSADDILQMKKDGVSDDVIISMIRHRNAKPRVPLCPRQRTQSSEPIPATYPRRALSSIPMIASAS